MNKNASKRKPIVCGGAFINRESEYGVHWTAGSLLRKIQHAVKKTLNLSLIKHKGLLVNSIEMKENLTKHLSVILDGECLVQLEINLTFDKDNDKYDVKIYDDLNKENFGGNT